MTAKRLIDEGAIGEVIEVHFYDGNRGPLFHTADKVEISPEEREREKPFTWFYKKEAGGGSLLDYLGYGATLGTWYHGGRAPIEVTTVVDEPSHLEVDEHSITVARYACGLSKFETRWGTHFGPLDPPAAAQVRVRHRRKEGKHLQLRLRENGAAADARRTPRAGTCRWTPWSPRGRTPSST